MGMMISRRRAASNAEAPAERHDAETQKTRAELVAEAKAMGISVPSRATKEAIQAMIEEAK